MSLSDFENAFLMLEVFLKFLVTFSQIIQFHHMKHSTYQILHKIFFNLVDCNNHKNNNFLKIANDFSHYAKT